MKTKNFYHTAQHAEEKYDKITERIIARTKKIEKRYACFIGSQQEIDGKKYKITGFNDLGVTYGKRVVNGKPRGEDLVLVEFDPEEALKKLIK